MATHLILAISISAGVSVTKHPIRASEWFKDNTVWFIIEQRRTQRQNRVMEHLIGARCEKIDEFWHLRWRSRCFNWNSFSLLLPTADLLFAQEIWDSAEVFVCLQPAPQREFNHLSASFSRRPTCKSQMITINQIGVWLASHSRWVLSTSFACKLRFGIQITRKLKSSPRS